ncbi:MAG: hypothetical protein FWG20_01585 [Candidatus Cloacimonetes bacterium]|nr:hypothetical protein [Candidatus Cloacimonadota bacterium]
MKNKMILTVLLICAIGVSLLSLPVVSATGYDLEMTIKFKDNVEDKELAKIISKFPKHNFREKEEIDYPWDAANQTNLKQFVYSDSVFMNQLIAENIKKESSVIWVEFHPKQFGQRYSVQTAPEKIEYSYDVKGRPLEPKSKISVCFNHRISEDEMRAFIQRYEKYQFKLLRSHISINTYSFYFNPYLIDGNELVQMIEKEVFVKYAYLDNAEIRAN